MKDDASPTVVKESVLEKVGVNSEANSVAITDKEDVLSISPFVKGS
jgi:hypothetical protein